MELIAIQGRILNVATMDFVIYYIYTQFNQHVTAPLSMSIVPNGADNKRFGIRILVF
jgi:hypothetical protein